MRKEQRGKNREKRLGIKMERGCRIILLTAFLFLLPAFFSCTPAKTEQPAAELSTVLSPLETVRNLIEENKQSVTARTASTTAHPREIKEILDRGYIVFAMTANDVKPFFYHDEKTGELIGLDVEIAYAIANRLGVKPVFNRDATSFDGVVMQVIENKADVALSKLSRTARRSELVRFTSPYITFRQALLINRLEFAKIGTEAQLPQYIKNYTGTIGVIKNSSYANYALANFPAADIKAFDTWDDAVDALFDGKIMAVYRDEGEILIINSSRKDASILMKPVFINDKRDPIAMAVSAEAPLLQEWLNLFLADYLVQNQKELTPSRLVKRHFK